MPGSASLTAPEDAVRDGPAAVFVVCRAWGIPQGSPEYEPLPWLKFVSVKYTEGAPPWVARFRFDFGDVNPEEWALRLEEGMDRQSGGEFRLSTDDRIVVFRLYPDGGLSFVFDGYLRANQVDADGNSEVVTVDAVATPMREWAAPLSGATYRDSHRPDVVPETSGGGGQYDYANRDVKTDRPIRFNPDGKSNATPEAVPSLSVDGDVEYAVFMDEDEPQRHDEPADAEKTRRWTLNMGVTYASQEGNPEQFFVRNKLFDPDELKAIVPEGDSGVIDLDDDATFKYEEIYLSDRDHKGRAWPEVVDSLVAEHGFLFVWRLESEEVEESEESAGGIVPVWRWDVVRRDTARDTKAVALQKAREWLDLDRTNVTSMSFQRDMPAANLVWVRTAPVVVEAGFILGPAFKVTAGDEDPGENVWKTSHPKFKDHVDEYRKFIAGEGGDRYWDLDLAAWVADEPLDLIALFPDDEDGNRTYVHRRRRPLQSLVSRDGYGKIQKAQLYISTDVGRAPTGATKPKVWDNATMSAAHWQVAPKGWHILDDQIGIYISVENPFEWEFGVPDTVAVTNQDIADGVTSVVDAMAHPAAFVADPPGGQGRPPHQRFWLMLVCAIQSDHEIPGTIAKVRSASPTQYPIARHDDSSDRFRKEVISKHSYLSSDFTKDQPFRDDTRKALVRAMALRRTVEGGKFAGRVTIPWCSDFYSVGDKVAGIVGRGVSFNGLAAEEQGETPLAPSVVAVDLVNEPRQGTVLHLEDRRAEPRHAEETAKDDKHDKWPALVKGEGFNFHRPDRMKWGVKLGFEEAGIIGGSIGVQKPP